jgi:hypothetical protein
LVLQDENLRKSPTQKTERPLMSANRKFVVNIVSSLLGLVGLLIAIAPVTHALGAGSNDTHRGYHGSVISILADNAQDVAPPTTNDTHW